MKAAVFQDDGLSYGEFPQPIATDEALPIRVRAAALTNLDVITAEGRHYLSSAIRSLVPGNECVAELPGGERRYFPVTSLISPYGSLAEFALGRQERSLTVVSGIPDVMAAALGNAGLAGWLPFSWRAGLKRGENVVILGATGTTGLIAVCAARLLGAGKIIAVGRNSQALEKARSLGASAIISLSQAPDISNPLGEALSGEGVDIIIDYLNGPATQTVLAQSNVGCRLVQIGSVLGPDISISAQIARRQSLSVFGFAYYHAPRAIQQAAYNALCQAALRNEIFVDLTEVPLADIEAAWTRQKEGGVARQVIVP